MTDVTGINTNLGQTIGRFGVPNPNTGQGLGLLMPKLKNRYRVLFFGMPFSNTPAGALDLTAQTVTASRPQRQFNNTALHSYNNIVYIAQKPEWQPVEIVLRDDISNRVTSIISAQQNIQQNSYTQDAAVSGTNYKFAIAIQTLDGSMGTNNVLENWLLDGCYIESVNYDSLDFASSEPVQITISLRYDNATQGNEASIITSLDQIVALA